VKVRFQADADLRVSIVTGLRRRHPEVDFQSAQFAQLEGLEDRLVLQQAAAQGRMVVSHDFASMLTHFASFVARRDSPGLFLVSQRLPVRDAIDWLLLVWEAPSPRTG
jgi:Domain of unknown function (DUF5615)